MNCHICQSHRVHAHEERYLAGHYVKCHACGRVTDLHSTRELAMDAWRYEAWLATRAMLNSRPFTMYVWDASPDLDRRDVWEDLFGESSLLKWMREA